MVSAPAPWQLTLARIEGALPFISPELSECLALASLRHLWRLHVRDYPFDNLGIEHNPGLEADELVRSWYSEERRQFLSWISRRGHPPLADAAKLVMAAKNHSEGFSECDRPKLAATYSGAVNHLIDKVYCSARSPGWTSYFSSIGELPDMQTSGSRCPTQGDGVPKTQFVFAGPRKAKQETVLGDRISAGQAHQPPFERAPANDRFREADPGESLVVRSS